MNDIFPVAGSLVTFTMGSTTVNFPAGQSDSPQAVVIPYVNTAAGAHIMQIDTSPPVAKNVNTLDDDATRLLQVGPPSPVVGVDKLAALLDDADGSGVVSPGDTLRYTIFASNLGSVDASGAAVFDDYDERLTGTPSNISGGDRVANGSIQWNLGTLAASQTVTRTWTREESKTVAASSVLNITTLPRMASSAATLPGRYVFDMDLGERKYRIVAAQPSDMLDGKELEGTLGGDVYNLIDSNVIGNIEVPQETGDVLADGYDFANILVSRLQGLVWEDTDNDGEVDQAIRELQLALVAVAMLDVRVVLLPVFWSP